MYEKYWNLERVPFSNRLDPEFFFPSQSHQSAFLKLRYVIENGHGLGVLCGGIGSGKTFLIGHLGRTLEDSLGPLVHVMYPCLSPPELLSSIIAELDPEGSEIPDDPVPMDRILHRLASQLEQLTGEKRHPVIVIEDCQSIENPGVFQALQLLLNYRDRPALDFTLLLVGEPSLLPRLDRNAALSDRVGVVALLQPFNEAETAEYVKHRLSIVNCSSDPFSEEALLAIHAHSGGIPRRINRLCDLALLMGFADHLPRIEASDIAAVSGEIQTALRS